MQSKPSRWRSDPYEVAAGRALAEGLGVSPVVGAILARRGLGELEEARRFLAADESHDPLTLPGVPEACELILGHAGRGSQIAVFGDYDVDGVCSTAMLVRALRALGADPVWELPSRFDEGYGLSAGAVERLAGRGREAARDGRLRHHRGRARGRGARRRPRRDRHRPPPSRRRAAGLHGRPSRARRLRLPGAVRVGRGAEADRGALRRGRARLRRRRPRTPTSPRSPRSATSCRCAARTAASCATGLVALGPDAEARAARADGDRRGGARRSCPSTRSGSGSARASTPPAACSVPTPALELLLTDDTRARARWRASSTS